MKKKQLLSRNNSYLGTSPTTMPKNDESWYCIKDVATLKSLNLNYQPKVCTKLQVIVLSA